MKVGICYTKKDKVGIGACNAFSNGVLSQGDTPISIYEYNTHLLQHCDVTVQVCDYTHYLGKDLRYVIKEHCQHYNKPRIIIDTGFFSLLNNRNSQSLDRYMAVGIGGIKGNAIYNNLNSPPDRWETLLKNSDVPNVLLKLDPWQHFSKTRSYILILGQHEKGISTQNIDTIGWFEQLLVKLNKHTDRPILYRCHPNQKKFPNKFLYHGELFFSNLHFPSNIYDDLQKSYVTIAKTTNASVDSILAGVQVICNDPMNIVYNIAETELSHVNSPRFHDRTQFLYDLAYAQWSIKEMAKGLPWEHLKKYIEKNYEFK